MKYNLEKWDLRSRESKNFWAEAGSRTGRRQRHNIERWSRSSCSLLAGKKAQSLLKYSLGQLKWRIRSSSSSDIRLCNCTTLTLNNWQLQLSVILSWHPWRFSGDKLWEFGEILTCNWIKIYFNSNPLRCQILAYTKHELIVKNDRMSPIIVHTVAISPNFTKIYSKSTDKGRSSVCFWISCQLFIDWIIEESTSNGQQKRGHQRFEFLEEDHCMEFVYQWPSSEVLWIIKTKTWNEMFWF